MKLCSHLTICLFNLIYFSQTIAVPNAGAAQLLKVVLPNVTVNVVTSGSLKAALQLVLDGQAIVAFGWRVCFFLSMSHMCIYKALYIYVCNYYV